MSFQCIYIFFFSKVVTVIFSKEDIMTHNVLAFICWGNETSNYWRASETHSDVTWRYIFYMYGTCVLNFDHIWKYARAEFSANHFVEYSVASDNSYKNILQSWQCFFLVSSSLNMALLLYPN